MRKTLAVLVLLVLSAVVSAQGLTNSDSKVGDLRKKQLEDGRIKGLTVSDLLSDLAFTFDIPIGLEMAMNVTVLRKTRIDIKSSTVEDALTRILAEYPQYSWEIKDDVVNVFPKEGYRDPIVQRVLSLEIGNLSIKKNTCTFCFEKDLRDTQEMKQVADAYGLQSFGWSFSGFYFPMLGRNFSLDVTDMPVKSILNRIAKESPTAKFWCVTRDSNYHALSIAFRAMHEDSIKTKFELPDFLDELDP